MPELFSIDWLVPKVRWFASIWKGEILTEEQTICGLLDVCIMTLAKHPGETEALARISDTIPKDLRVAMVERMTQLPTPDGRWDWPVGGMLVNPGGVVSWQTPDAEVQAAIAALRVCLTRSLNRSCT